MKQTPEEQAVTARMAPGVLCREGFLGDDPRPLGEILDTDNSTVMGLNLTHQAIADRLAEALHQAVAGLGTRVPLGFREGLTAVHREAMGRIPCPWGGCGTFRKGEVELADEAAGRFWRMFLFTPLSVHQIARHGFYQGRGSRYRLEPQELCESLGLVG